MRIRRIQGRLPSLNIRLSGPHPLRPLQDLPYQEKRREDGNTHIGSDEIIQLEFLDAVCGGESVESVQEGDDEEEEEGEVGCVGLQGGFEDEGVAGDALRGEGAVELDVGD